VPIRGTDVRLSPAWWMDRLFRKLSDHKRYNRLEDLHQRYRGNPPLPEGAEAARELFQAFQRKSRTNYAELAVAAISERMSPVGFRTAADSDETGDAKAREAWTRARMNIVSADAHDMMLNLGEAYVIVGLIDEDHGVPVVTAEDPRFVVGEPDPMNPYKLRAALKYLRDDIEGEDRAYLYLPGEVWVARREAPYSPAGTLVGPMYWSPETWDWVPDRSGTLGHPGMCVIPFFNKDMQGEYEKHIDILDRINYQTLSRLCTAALQAFKQRAIQTDAGSGGLETEDEDGNEIDYSQVFTSDPAAIWMLPEGAKIWESSTADLRQILEVNKDDVMQFAAVTRTPMYYLNPGGANQSADGAAMQRESLLFKTGDRINRASPQWASVMAMIFTVMGDSSRADLSKLQTLWSNPARLSLSEKASAAAQIKDIIPWRSLMTYVFDFDPDTVERMESEREEEALAAMQRQQLMLAQAQDSADQQGDGTDGTGSGNADPGLNKDVSGLAGGQRDVTTGNVPPQLAR
jgi:hypothetical protein